MFSTLGAGEITVNANETTSAGNRIDMQAQTRYLTWVLRVSCTHNLRDEFSQTIASYLTHTVSTHAGTYKDTHTHTPTHTVHTDKLYTHTMWWKRYVVLSSMTGDPWWPFLPGLTSYFTLAITKEDQPGHTTSHHCCDGHSSHAVEVS